MSITKPTPSLLLATLLLALLTAPDLRANCESGAYLIYTVAEYARLDDKRRWFFRTILSEGRLRLDATVAHTDIPPRRLAAFLRGPHRESFRLSRQGETCAPELGTPRAVTLARTNNVMMETHFVRFPSCGTSSGATSWKDSGYARFDRDTKTLHLPVTLASSQAADFAGRAQLENDLKRKIFDLGLRATEGAEATIAPADVDDFSFEILRIGDGDPAFRMIVAVLRLRNLDRLLGSGDYNTLESVRGKLAEFPVIFWQRPGGEPFYVGDGSWCSTYRLHVNVSVRATAETVRNLGPMERFELTAAYDLSGDGQPEILVVNQLIAYYLEVDDRLTVIDWQGGC